MMKAKGSHVIYLFFTSVLMLVPGPSHGWQRDTPQPSSHQTSRSTHAQDEKAAERSLWESIKESSNPRAYKTFLAKYPQGQFMAEARSRLSTLLGEAYVTLFTKRVNVNKQWASVESQLRRRADMIPDLILRLRVAGVQERKLIGQIVGARSRLLNATNVKPQGEGDDKTPGQKRAVIEAYKSFGMTLSRLDSLLEKYPQLRSNDGFMKARDELEGVGNRINVARADYNRSARDYNVARSQPKVASTAERHGFAAEPYFKSEEGQPAESRINSNPLIETPQ